jgi:hypothetical protein
MRRRLHLSVVLAGCLAALAIGASASATAAVPHRAPVAIVRVQAAAQPRTAAAVAKFLVHAGITYYVFDHYIWKPFKAGDLHGFTHAITIAKAAAAALIVYHEAKLMISDVKGSKTLSFLAAPITAVVAKLESLKSAVTGGNSTAINSIDSSLGSIQSQAGAKGIVIKEIAQSV